MSYHSNGFITRVVLRVNEAIPKRTPQLPNVEQVRQGAVTKALQHERTHFFAFARAVTGVLSSIIFLIGAIAMLFTAKGDFNIVFFTLSGVAAVLFVLTLKFKKRQETCKYYKEGSSHENLVMLSTEALLSSIPIGILLGIMVYLYLFLQRR